jgi:predicted DNA-binding transcriptional regulator AlpA
MTDDEKVHGAPEGAAVADEKLLTVPQAAARAQVDVSAIYRWFSKGILRKHMRPVGRNRTWVDSDELEAVLAPAPDPALPDRMTA